MRRGKSPPVGGWVGGFSVISTPGRGRGIPKLNTFLCFFETDQIPPGSGRNFLKNFCVVFFILVLYLVLKYLWTGKYQIITHFYFIQWKYAETYIFFKWPYYTFKVKEYSEKRSLKPVVKTWKKTARHRRKFCTKKYFFIGAQKIPPPPAKKPYPQRGEGGFTTPIQGCTVLRNTPTSQ